MNGETKLGTPFNEIKLPIKGNEMSIHVATWKKFKNVKLSDKS